MLDNKPDLTRKIQLSFFKPGCTIQQDQELIDIIANGKYTHAIGHGDIDYFSDYINFVQQGPVDLCIFIINHQFDFDDIVSQVNQTIQTQLRAGGLFYLSLNKYLAIPKNYDTTLPEDYDSAIEQFFLSRINFNICKYIPCGNDQGNQFNWAHPLTRFHIIK
jgi:hypothetical protein